MLNELGLRDPPGTLRVSIHHVLKPRALYLKNAPDTLSRSATRSRLTSL